MTDEHWCKNSNKVLANKFRNTLKGSYTMVKKYTKYITYIKYIRNTLKGSYIMVTCILGMQE